MIVTIHYTTTIPSEAVATPIVGTGYNGGRKSELEVTVDLAAIGSGALTVRTRTWGETREYKAADVVDVAGKPSWYKALVAGATPVKTARLEVKDSNLIATWVSVAGATHAVRLFVAGGNPLISPSPDIDGEFLVAFRPDGSGWEYKLTGEHDGFPSHKIIVGPHIPLDHDCVAEGQTPASLLPPSEFSVDTGWRAV
ncbi:hypothetical protein [uncultured Tateyamaria sp.]|uniref:hypothetical protein n=1 Tax=uncultured Tateyamaria sp. TaxID=455651 RepID=UPI00260A63EE|nr:hypothetical protein [uncultured Tateyamaria sp.]